jgi:hypothetical protein
MIPSDSWGSVLLSWVFNYEAFYLHVVKGIRGEAIRETKT